MEHLAERRYAGMVTYPIRLNTRQVDTLLQGGNQIRIDYGHDEYAYDFKNMQIVPVTWFPGQSLFVQEEFDTEPESKFQNRVYYRADYPNAGWRNWKSRMLMLESESRLKLEVLSVDPIFRIEEKLPVAWILTVERQ